MAKGVEDIAALADPVGRVLASFDKETPWIGAILPLGIQSLVHHCLTAMMTRRASASNQGELQGFATAVMALGSIAAPLIYNPLHARFAGPNPPFALDGIAFVVAAALALSALAILARLRPADQIPPAVTG